MPDVKIDRRLGKATLAPAQPVALPRGFDWLGAIRKRGPIAGALDVGANTGGYVHQWIELGASRVIALEPVPDLATQIRARFAGDRRVEVFQLGVSDAAGTLADQNIHNCWTLMPEHDATLARAREFVGKPPFDVTLTTIDALLAGQDFAPDFIKIDVDGYDAKAMRGARGYLAKRRPIVMLEISYLPHFLGDCCECMIRDVFALGYQATSHATGEVFADARALMRKFPWDTSWDVLLEPK